MKKPLEGLLQRALDRAAKGGRLKSKSLPPLLLEVPKESKFGDLASTIALQLARAERRNPREIAETIRDHFEDPEGLIAAVSIEGPGYLNFRFSPKFWSRCLLEAVDPEYGRADVGEGRRVLIEFVSANPTGPLHVGHGRGAVIGDTIARLLTAGNYVVTREYYINDAGKQLDTLARSMFARLLQACGHPAPFPEDGYPGEYLEELATRRRDELIQAIAARAGESVPAEEERLAFLQRVADTAAVVCGELAAVWLMDLIRDDLRILGVEFDSFVSESALRREGAVERALEAMRSRGLVYEREGAQWFRSSQFGDEKDRVVRRSDGELTYFASDIAYHFQKLRCGYDELIDVWGADHHGYIPRVKAAIEAFGRDPNMLTVVLVQMVRLTRAGEPVRMGKRTGEFVTMREVVDEVGSDAARFFFLMRKADSHLDFDLELAKKQTSDNPVFYVQYAHARICSLFRQAERQPCAVSGDEETFCRLDEPEEQEVIRLIAQYPDLIEDATRQREPHRIVFFLIDLAAAFHRFYNRHRIIGSEPAVRNARLFLARAVKHVLKKGLSLLGIRAPESM